MSNPLHSIRPNIEPLEARIAPAATAIASANWIPATLGAPIALHAGDGLSTASVNGGTYLLYVEKGDALVFTTDLNNNGDVDFNEITGIAAGDGLRLVSFVDIHGDIATNLVKTTAVISGVTTTKLSLTDSDNDRTNDPYQVGDGKVLANSSIEKIELRSLTVNDLATDQNGDGTIDATDVAFRKAYTTYSIFGNIYAGKSFGATGAGLIIDSTGATQDLDPGNFGFDTHPSVGAIKTGTAASGEFFSYGVSNLDDVTGTFVTFTPGKGQAGGDIIGVKSSGKQQSFGINGLYSGDGGLGARGGNIQDVTLNQDDTSGYQIIAGNGGRGSSGGAGGSIINFSDLTSQTGKVTIQSGSGGNASTGAGGNAGSLDTGTFSVYGSITVNLGAGGDGFTAGGNGASLTKGVFNQPDPVKANPGSGYGTMHNPTVDGDTNMPGFQAIYSPNIGTHQGIDIDGDGNGDFVFTSKAVSQLVVVFGNGTGGFRTKTGPDGVVSPDRIYLSGVRNAEALTVADLNGDGHPDIAVASEDAGSQLGIAVFLANYEDADNNGLSTGEDANHNGVNDFKNYAGNVHPFTESRFTNLPQLSSGDPTSPNATFPYWNGPVQISNLMAGDYDGDGKTEIAAVVTYYGRKTSDPVTGTTISLSKPGQVLLYLTPDQELNNATGGLEYTGQFYANFGTKATVVNGAPIAAAPRIPFADITTLYGVAFSNGVAAHNYAVETTALNTNAGHDVVIVGKLNETSSGFNLFKKAYAVDYSTPANGLAPAFVGNGFGYGQVDTDRDLSDSTKSDKKNLEDVLLQDFTVVDLDGDNNADLGVISVNPKGYLVGVIGDGVGGGTQNSGSSTAGPFPFGPGQPGDNANDNQGTYLGDKGTKTGTNLLSIKSYDVDGDGKIDDLAIYDASSTVAQFIYQAGPQPTLPITNGMTQTTGALYVPGSIFIGPTTTEYFTDVLIKKVNDPTDAAFIYSRAGTARPTFLNKLIVDEVASQPLLDNGLKITAGDGGNALVGKGGAGGSFGTGSKLTTVTDASTGLSTTDLTGTVSASLSGAVRFFAGNGGNGFTSGGKGGSINGLVVRTLADPDFDPTDDTASPNLPITAALVAGDGGRGISGAGGAGGDLLANSIYSLVPKTSSTPAIFLAGAGGEGRIGGDGGDVTGNRSSVYDVLARAIKVVAGDAGDGQLRGGLGGNITNFSPQAGDPSSEFYVTTLQYTAGDGGDAVGGPGGKGGSIINSSPKLNDGVQGQILLEGGDGGNGIIGGDGGAISKFIITPAGNSKRPTNISALAGSGGDGMSGNGGRGGSIDNVSVPTRGVDADFSLTGVNFNRVIGGAGGNSSGGKGGEGGDVSAVTISAVAGAAAIASGAGGNGLSAGGAGGDILNIKLALAASKALIIAGAGGDASAFVANVNDSAPSQGNNSFGGKAGVGGNGGNIIGVFQQGSIGVHTDLIAGDGGSTINFGSARDIKGFAGKGGSIQGIKLEADVGNVLDNNVPIKSYNNLLGGETMASWVDANLRGNSLPTLDDAAGNVGIVVGVAGRNKAVVTDPTGHPTVYTKLPSSNVVNGSLIDVEARNIMSAIAGSVDKIASIQVAKNIRVLNGTIGSDKPVLGQKNYLDPTGAPTTDGRPVRDGRLVDGAFIAQVLLDAAGKPSTLPTDRFFTL